VNDENLQELIDQWKGGEAILFEYRISHGFLRIAVSSDSKNGCLDIVCGSTEYIRGRTRWANCDLKIESVDYKNEYGIPIYYIIKDENADFEVHCAMISATELPDFNDLVPVFGQNNGLPDNGSDSRFAREKNRV
jgi:hypothetical protein